VVIAYRDADGDLHGNECMACVSRDLAVYLEGSDGEKP
jgi:hypothetical protein